jgi:hypothetical protein
MYEQLMSAVTATWQSVLKSAIAPWIEAKASRLPMVLYGEEKFLRLASAAHNQEYMKEDSLCGKMDLLAH